MSTALQLRSWILHEPLVVSGAAPPGLLTLDELACPRGPGVLGDRLVYTEGARRAESLLALYWAATTAVDLVVAPLPYDGIEVFASPAEVGIVPDDRLGLSALWAGAVSEAPGRPNPYRLGLTVASLLRPVLLDVVHRGHVTMGRASCLLREEVTSRIRRLEGETCDLTTPGWADHVLAGAGVTGQRSTRAMYVSDGELAVGEAESWLQQLDHDVLDARDPRIAWMGAGGRYAVGQ